METWSRPPRHGTTGCADPEAAWGHRNSNLPGPRGEMFFGYYLSAATMVAEEHGPPVAGTGPPDDPHLLRPGPGPRPGPRPDQHARGRHRASATSWPTPATPTATPPPGRSRCAPPARNWSRTCTRTTAGPSGTHHGAIIANGNLYCPATPGPLLHLGPLPPAATTDRHLAHDQQTANSPGTSSAAITADDADGYHRVTCPAAAGKIRCPLRPDSMTLDRSRPEILTPPQHPPACCTQQTITVPPDVAAKTRQKHDYPSAAHRRSYARRTGAERTFSTIKDPATTSISPRLVPPHGPDPAHPLARLPARHPQPAHPHRLRHPPGRQRPPRRRRASRPEPENAAARPSPASPPARHNTRRHATVAEYARPPAPAASPRQHEPSTPPAAPQRQPGKPPPRPGSRKRRQNVRPKCEHRPW